MKAAVFYGKGDIRYEEREVKRTRLQGSHDPYEGSRNLRDRYAYL